MYQEGSGGDGAVWLITQKRIGTGADGLTLMSLTAADAKEILARRIVDYFAGTSYTSKTATIDDMMKAIVREQLGASGPYSGTYATGRDLVTAGALTIQADTSALPSVSKAFAWRNVLTVLQELASAASDTDNYCAFDVVKSATTGALEFRTYPDVRGVSRAYYLTSGAVNPNALIVTPDNGSLTEPAIDLDYSKEYNYVRAAGEGEGSARLTGQAQFQARIYKSPYARRERFLDSRNGGSSSVQLQYEAISEIYINRARVRMSGKVTESLSVKYGRNYRHGDILTAEAFGYRFDARVTVVSVSVSAAGETIEAQLAGDQVLAWE